MFLCGHNKYVEPCATLSFVIRLNDVLAAAGAIYSSLVALNSLHIPDGLTMPAWAAFNVNAGASRLSAVLQIHRGNAQLHTSHFIRLT
jgi:hypothetical protein